MKIHAVLVSSAVTVLAAAFVVQGGYVAQAVDIPDGVFVDESYDPMLPTVFVDEDGNEVNRATCPDRAFTAIPTMTTSVGGCNVIGTTNSTKVTYGWYVQAGNVKEACIWGRGYNSKHSPIWTELSCGSGRTKAVAWGNVLATKHIQGLTGTGWAGIQWS